MFRHSGIRPGRLNKTTKISVRITGNPVPLGDISKALLLHNFCSCGMLFASMCAYYA
jgi:hypothetical protein